MSKTILPKQSPIYRCFLELIDSADRVFFAGLPGVGKSLLLQQLALMALEKGRDVYLAQWDRARQPFESPLYPLQQGATHPIVIKAAGTWLRRAILAWQKAHSGANAMLIGEVPLIGGRFMEIVSPADDAAEALLAGKGTQFVLPLPSREVRALIEKRREASIAKPAHENEAQDAPPELLRALWQELNQVAFQLGISAACAQDAPYSPQIYEAAYRHLLRHRQVTVLPIDAPLRPAASVYAFADELPQLIASRERAQATLREIEAVPSSARGSAAWYEV